MSTEYDLLIQSLRRTNFFNENTNERRGLDVKPLGTSILGSSQHGATATTARGQ